MKYLGISDGNFLRNNCATFACRGDVFCNSFRELDLRYWENTWYYLFVIMKWNEEFDSRPSGSERFILVHRIKLITWAKFIWGLLLKSVDFLDCNDSSCPRRQMHLRYCYYEWKQETIVDKKKKWRWEFPPDLTKNKDILWPQNKKNVIKWYFAINI